IFRPELTASEAPTDQLDAALLQRHVLGPIFAIADPRTSKRIQFVGGIRGPAELEKLVNSGEFACAFSMFPTSIEDLIAIADAGFNASLNPYRGCEHVCIYCYARPTHEYLGFSAGLDFESRIMVKENAPELLRRELASPKWRPQVLAFSGVTDCYQPVERKL